MTRLALSLMLTADHIGSELRRYWKRLLVGAFAGWAAATFLGAFALAFYEGPALEVLASVIVWGGIGVGMWVAWRGRA